MAIIGIALVEIGARDAVERGEHDFRLEIELGERGAGRARERLDIGGIVVIGRGDAQGRLPAHRLAARRTPCRRPSPSSPRNIADRAARAGCGRSPWPATRRGARRSTACRSASPSRPRSRADPGRAQRQRELFRLAAGDRLQRALVALAVPDRIVVAPLGARAARQDDEVEDRPPEPARRLDHAPVGEEFVEIAAHRPIVGRFRRAEIDEQHADAAALDRRVARRAKRGGRARRVHRRFVGGPASGVKAKAASWRPSRRPR